MDPIVLPKDYNYVAAFLTFSCQLRCSYCINHHGGDLIKGRRMTAQDWITGLNRLQLSPDLPITLQGGEPTVYKEFYEVVAGIRPELNLDLLTNLSIDVDEFMDRIPPTRFKRNAPYASIRVSWHIGQNSDEDLLDKVSRMMKRGYSVGIWAVDHPDHTKEIKDAQLLAWNMGIDFRVKEFLGPHKGVNHGTFRYDDAVNGEQLRYCECRTSELLIAPDGSVFRCHSDLYANRMPVGHINDRQNPLVGKWVPCSVYGKCNSCDVKLKFNRFQEKGHSSVNVRNVSAPYALNNSIQEVINTYGKPDSKAQ